MMPEPASTSVRDVCMCGHSRGAHWAATGREGSFGGSACKLCWTCGTFRKAEMSVSLKVTEQNVPREYADSGLDAITVEGNRLSVDGWYDSLMAWSATVTLTDEQRRALHDALGDGGVRRAARAGPTMSKTREGLDNLLRYKPSVDVAKYDDQGEKPMVATDIVTGETSVLTTLPEGPWVCVDFADGERYAIWKTTGAVYRVTATGAVEDDPVEL